jgi:hypothetical protein
MVLNELPAILTKSNFFFMLINIHSLLEAHQLLLDVLLEGSPPSPPLLLNLGIRISRQGEGVGASTSK